MKRPPKKKRRSPIRPAAPVKGGDAQRLYRLTARRQASTYFHRRVTHPTALRAFQARSAVRRDAVHHKGRAMSSEKPARPPAGSLFAATGGRHRRLTMSRHSPRRSLRRSQGRRRDASTPEAAKRRSYVAPVYESKSSAPAQMPDDVRGRWRAPTASET